MFLNKKSLIRKWQVEYLHKINNSNETEGFFISVFGDILSSPYCYIEIDIPKVNNITDLWFLTKDDAIQFRTSVINELVQIKEQEIKKLIEINEKN